MGFNIFRWLRDPTYRAVKRWKRVKGDATLKVDFPLTPESVVFDVGAYKGEYSAEISNRYGCRVEAFEPVPAYADLARKSLSGMPKVNIRSFGLSDRDGSLEMSIEGLGSSAFRDGPNRIVANFLDAAAVVSDLDQIDLIKINVEGGEYAILPRLVLTQQIGKFNSILVQFHLIQDGDQERYEAIARDLAKTHRLVWRFPFIWELWERLPRQQ